MRTTTDSKAKQKQTNRKKPRPVDRQFTVRNRSASGTMGRKEFSNGAVINIGYLTERQHKAADEAKPAVDQMYNKALEQCYRDMSERG